MQDWIQFLKDIAELSRPIAMQHFKSAALGVDVKADKTPVSQADLEIENYIRKLVGKRYPNISIMGEEYGETKGKSDTTLIIDPIDGTKNFIAGLPFFATLLAIESKGEVFAGLVSAPATGDMWWAQKNQGAFHNGQPIKVSTVNSLDQALAFHGSLFGSEAADDSTKIISLLKQTYRQRGFGDYYSHMLVAMGCGEFAFDFKLKPWDIAPLKIIVEEAGGRFSDVDGQDSIYSGNLITSNGKLHDLVQKQLNGVY